MTTSQLYAGAGACVIVGVLIGILLTIVTRWIAEGIRAARVRRWNRRRPFGWVSGARPSPGGPLPQLWAFGQDGQDTARARTVDSTPGSIDEYRKGQLRRPDWRPEPGPRDW